MFRSRPAPESRPRLKLGLIPEPGRGENQACAQALRRRPRLKAPSRIGPAHRNRSRLESGLLPELGPLPRAGSGQNQACIRLFRTSTPDRPQLEPRLRRPLFRIRPAPQGGPLCVRASSASLSTALLDSKRALIGSPVSCELISHGASPSHRCGATQKCYPVLDAFLVPDSVNGHVPALPKPRSALPSVVCLMSLVNFFSPLGKSSRSLLEWQQWKDMLKNFEQRKPGENVVPRFLAQGDLLDRKGPL